MVVVGDHMTHIALRRLSGVVLPLYASCFTLLTCCEQPNDLQLCMHSDEGGAPSQNPVKGQRARDMHDKRLQDSVPGAGTRLLSSVLQHTIICIHVESILSTVLRQESTTHAYQHWC